MLDADPDRDPEDIEFVALLSGGQGYCIEITSVREIRRWSSVTTLPNSDSSVLGVMNLRGAVIPIIDLSSRLGFKPTDVGPRCVVVVVSIGNRVVGLVVEAVSEIISTARNSIKPNPNIGNESDSGHVTGLFPKDDDMLRVLAVERMFDFADGEAA